jgi:DNA-binding response OmpR family regulator
VIREARSADDVDRNLESSGQAIVLIDLATRAEAGVQALLRASEHHARPMILVLEPTCLSQNRLLTRELGATHVLSGVIVPPLVVAVLERWHRISTRRREAEGWYDGVVENSTGSNRADEFESPFLLAPRPQ